LINLTKKVITQALDSAQQALVIIDAKKTGYPVAYVNPAFELLVGFDAGDLIGRPLKKLIVNGEMPRDSTAGSGDAAMNGTQRIRQSWQVKDGGSREIDLHVSPLYDQPGRPTYWLLGALLESGGEERDLEARTELQHALNDAQLQLRRLERADPATGIPNRRAFLEVVQRDWAIARREQRRLGIIVFRVDAFDEYRELFGRHATDSCLRKVAHAISGSLRRDGDFGARFDNDRFAILIGSANDDQALELAESIEKKVRTLAIHHPRSEVARYVTVSFGVATEIPAWTEQPSALVDEAEIDLRRRESLAEAARAQSKAESA
jgi:diguanylate cyclase (GGDEF)-like protein/PAS domain S-box-containing protein